MKHGEQRNRHAETTYGPQHEWRGASGFVVTVPLFAQTQTVSERWCAVCGEWVEARGIMGGLLCPVCHTEWHGASA